MQHEYCIIVHISPLVMLNARFHTQYSVGTDQVAGEIYLVMYIDVYPI